MKDHKLARKLRIATLGAASALLLAPLANAQSEDTDEAQVSVEPSEPQVSVKQAEPEVTVDDSADPNVNVTNDQDDAEGDFSPCHRIVPDRDDADARKPALHHSMRYW